MSESQRSPLTLRLFGPIEVLLDGDPLPRLRGRKGLWLLALLALRHPRPVDRDWLAGVLWPESDLPQMLASPREALTDLRSCMGTALVAPWTPVIKDACDVCSGLEVLLAGRQRGEALNAEVFSGVEDRLGHVERSAGGRGAGGPTS